MPQFKVESFALKHLDLSKLKLIWSSWQFLSNHRTSEEPHPCCECSPLAVKEFCSDSQLTQIPCFMEIQSSLMENMLITSWAKMNRVMLTTRRCSLNDQTPVLRWQTAHKKLLCPLKSHGRRSIQPWHWFLIECVGQNFLFPVFICVFLCCLLLFPASPPAHISQAQSHKPTW